MVHQGIKFRQAFSLKEIKQRWHSLLFDLDSARLINWVRPLLNALRLACAGISGLDPASRLHCLKDLLFSAAENVSSPVLGTADSSRRLLSSFRKAIPRNLPFQKNWRFGSFCFHQQAPCSILVAQPNPYAANISRWRSWGWFTSMLVLDWVNTT